MNFLKKKPKDVINSGEYEKLSKKNTELLSELEELKVKFNILRTDMDNLRGNFNRKLNKIKQEDLAEEETKEQSINNPVILPYNGSFR